MWYLRRGLIIRACAVFATLAGKKICGAIKLGQELLATKPDL